MRVSNYISGAPLPSAESYLILHGYTGALDKVSFALGDFLIAHRGMQWAPKIANLDLTEDAIGRLASRGYLTEKTDGEEREHLMRIAIALHERDLSMRVPGVVIIPTYTCNLRCTYCFQPHEMHSGKGAFSSVMTESQIDDIFRIITAFAHAGSVASALGLTNSAAKPAEGSKAAVRSIMLFGGEPLSSTTLPIVRYLAQKTASMGLGLKAITNGVDLHLFADLLGPEFIGEIQVTLDGLAELHDKRRVGPGFRRTFDIISRNIGLALDHRVNVNVRINVDRRNISQLGDLHDYFSSMGWYESADFRATAAAVHSSTPWVVGDVIQLRPRDTDLCESDLVFETRRLRDGSGCLIESYEPLVRRTLNKLLFGGGYPFESVSYCGATSGQLIFDPLGDVYTCWEDVGHSELRMGTFDEGNVTFSPQIGERWLTRFPGSIEQCSRCPYALIHKSGCGNHARQGTGTLSAAACESFQEYFPSLLARLYADFEATVLTTGHSYVR